MRVRMGIRGKLLTVSAAAIALAVVLELLAQSASLRAGREIEDRITRYHDIHLLRVALAEHRALTERYLREGREEDLRLLQEGLLGLEARAIGIEPYGKESLDAYFEVKAARAGIEAYVPLASSSAARRAGRMPEYWAPFARADRIAAYTDGYLTKLLSIAMRAGEAEYRAILTRSRRVRNLALAGVIGGGALALLALALLSASITAPLRRLARAAERISAGELGVEAEAPRTGDEVETLAAAFNAMSADIRDLVAGLEEKADLQRRLHEEELALLSMGKALREAQLMNLQDQMRPHFLFNALNTISRSALLEGAADTERLAQGLGALMRYAISSNTPMARLDEEFEVAEEYLKFQAIRFGSRLTWRLRLEPGLEGARIPRFSLQPLVENAVRHGIEPALEGGSVHLSAQRRGGRLRVVVADSGLGMVPEVLGRLRTAALGAGLPPPSEAPVPGPNTPGIGFANVGSRLWHAYGAEASLSISSRPGRGTIIRLSLPAEAALHA